MLRAIDISRAGMLRQGSQLDVRAHNIANVTTPGFRAFRALLEGGEAGTPQPGAPVPPLGGQVPTAAMFRQGPIRETGVPTDLAIDGEGFFIVERPDGTQAYTRGGAFRRDAQGRLVDGAGNALQGVTLPDGVVGLRIAAGGQVLAVMADRRTQNVGQLQLARFINPQGLLAMGDGLFVETTASGPVQPAPPGQDGVGVVRAGALEAANADLADEMAGVLAAQRLYQLNTASFRMADEMLRMAATLPGST
jgi:flagellar basal-body rod protein FlgG